MRKSLGAVLMLLLFAFWVFGQANPHGVALAWTPAPADSTHAAAVSFNIYRGTTSGGPYNKIASATDGAYTDTSGIPNTSYFYVATGVDAGGFESAFSNEATAVFPKVTAGATGLTATPR